jgi:hypothetical protein
VTFGLPPSAAADTRARDDSGSAVSSLNARRYRCAEKPFGHKGFALQDGEGYPGVVDSTEVC